MFLFGQPVVSSGVQLLDICGGPANYTNGGQPQPFGYISSPGYPANYPPEVQCTCTLAGQNASEISLELLDYDLVPVPNAVLPYDWLEYTVPGQVWGGGQSLGTQVGPIQTGNQVVSVNFNANGLLAARGFWLKYSGINLAIVLLFVAYIMLHSILGAPYIQCGVPSIMRYGKP